VKVLSTNKVTAKTIINRQEQNSAQPQSESGKVKANRNQSVTLEASRSQHKAQ